MRKSERSERVRCVCRKVCGESAEFPRFFAILESGRDYTMFSTNRRMIRVSYYHWKKLISQHFYIPYYY